MALSGCSTKEKSNGSAVKNKSLNGKLKQTEHIQNTGKYQMANNTKKSGTCTINTMKISIFSKRVPQNSLPNKSYMNKLINLILKNLKRLAKPMRIVERVNHVQICGGIFIDLKGSIHLQMVKPATTGMNKFAQDLNGDFLIK